jgi:hypothetical protein
MNPSENSAGAIQRLWAVIRLRRVIKALRRQGFVVVVRELGGFNLIEPHLCPPINCSRRQLRCCPHWFTPLPGAKRSIEQGSSRLGEKSYFQAVANRSVRVKPERGIGI